ncbi:hypothetical protein ACFOET_11620 [Parapedobacter deserti]|uniref:Uncharacterized protein n=1 Tax=Parapedobacter deserti TaxID=1912957 RepID=A0ABV7JQ76_9SPHI
MKAITKILKKVVGQARKAVLLGAFLGGISMMSYAEETAISPTVEKAKVEVVNISLEAVVAAITKVDPNWVKGLPVVKRKAKRLETSSFALIDTDPLEADSYEHASAPPTCDPGVAEVCYIIAEVENPDDPEEDWRPVMTQTLRNEITAIFQTDPEDRDDTANVKLRDN